MCYQVRSQATIELATAEGFWREATTADFQNVLRAFGSVCRHATLRLSVALVAAHGTKLKNHCTVVHALNFMNFHLRVILSYSLKSIKYCLFWKNFVSKVWSKNVCIQMDFLKEWLRIFLSTGWGNTFDTLYYIGRYVNIGVSI